MKKTRKFMMILMAGCSLAIGATMISCESTKTANNDSNPRDNVIIGMANPFVDSKTLEDAANLVGFSIELPLQEDLPEWATEIIYRSSTVNTKLLEIIYKDPADKSNFNKEIRIRKGITETEDISGDFNSYEKEEIMILDGKSVNVKINEDKIILATWENGEYLYSLRISEGATEDTFANLVSTIK